MPAPLTSAVVCRGGPEDPLPRAHAHRGKAAQPLVS